MKKIPSLFERDWAGNASLVLDKVTPGCEWVIVGEGVATRKFDGMMPRMAKRLPQDLSLVRTQTLLRGIGWDGSLLPATVKTEFLSRRLLVISTSLMGRMSSAGRR